MIEKKLSKTGKVIKPTNPNQNPDKQWGRPWSIDRSDEVVIEELKDMLQALKSDNEIIYIWELFLEKDYSRSSFLNQVLARNENKEIVKVYDTIKEILETRAVKWLLGNQLNSTWTIFHLKNNYKWVDKQEVNSNNTNLNADVTEELTEAQKEKIAKRFMK